MRNEVTYFLRRSIQPKTNERGNVTQRNATARAPSALSRDRAEAQQRRCLGRVVQAPSSHTHTCTGTHTYLGGGCLSLNECHECRRCALSLSLPLPQSLPLNKAQWPCAQQAELTPTSAYRKHITTNVFNENKSSTRCLRRRRRLCRCCKSPPGDEFAVKILVAAVPAWRATELLLRCSRCCCR